MESVYGFTLQQNKSVHGFILRHNRLMKKHGISAQNFQIQAKNNERFETIFERLQNGNPPQRPLENADAKKLPAHLEERHAGIIPSSPAMAKLYNEGGLNRQDQPRVDMAAKHDALRSNHSMENSSKEEGNVVVELGRDGIVETSSKETEEELNKFWMQRNLDDVKPIPFYNEAEDPGFRPEPLKNEGSPGQRGSQGRQSSVTSGGGF